MEDPSREVKKVSGSSYPPNHPPCLLVLTPLVPPQVRKARNRRQEWNVLAYDKEFRPDARLAPSPYHGMSSEGSLSPDSR